MVLFVLGRIVIIYRIIDDNGGVVLRDLRSEEDCVVDYLDETVVMD